ncbi:MAG: SDR family oxidoreductase [Alphaproteobacteria bacterium]|nr:SDR family oxidoreductase [Alphaproteobacteria bacterium]MBO6863200.1 SDR family oxidoreductase [Alphaproteobacteria bacterium]
MGAGQLAIVTGGARRIGRRICEVLAAEGYAVCIHYNTSAEDAAQVKAGIEQAGGTAMTHSADLTCPGAAEELIDAALAFGRPGLLVNNASSFDYDTPTQWEAGRFEETLRTNLIAPLSLSRAFHARIGPGWVDPNIVTILDQKLFNRNPDYFSYTVAKAGLHEAQYLMAMAFGAECRVNAVAPGLTLVSGPQSQDQFDAVHGRTLLRRGTTPDDIAQAVLYLGRASGVTGTCLPVDCGQRHVASDRDVMFLSPGDGDEERHK